MFLCFSACQSFDYYVFYRSQSVAGNSGGDEESAHVTLSKSDVILTFQIEVKIFFLISLDKELYN